MASVAVMVGLLAAASCAATVLMAGVASVYGSLHAVQSSLDQEASDLRQLQEAHRQMDEELHRLRQEVSNATAAVARRDAAMGRSEEAARAAAADLRKVTAQLEEAEAAARELRERQDAASRAADVAAAARRGTSERLAEAQGALDDLRLGASEDRAWRDKVEAWRTQEQRFESDTRQALLELREKQLARPSAAAAPPPPEGAAPPSAAGAAAAVPPESHEAAPVASGASTPPAGGALGVSWYRECGCTGMEIEAVTILEGLARSLGAGRVRTNRCEASCVWPASTRRVLDQIELQWGERDLSDWLFADRPPRRVVFVVHAAFLGVCGLPDFLQYAAQDDPLARAVRGGRPDLLRVSRSMLETDRLDPMNAERCNKQFDAVWVPSKFNEETFSRSGVEASMLKVLPEAIDPRLFNCSAGSPPVRPPVPHFGVAELDQFVAAGVGHDVFTFLSVFKWEERKNWQALLETFWRTFPRRSTQVAQEDGQTVGTTVRLLIKTQYLSWGTHPDDDVAQLHAALGVSAEDAAGRLLVTREPLPLPLLPGLYRAADAFVLPSHGEGWGLPLMEAMASGLPTIATGWGGNTEFMHAGNAVLLGYRLVGAPHGAGTHRWAEPERPALRQAMQDAVTRSATLRSLAEHACEEVPGELYTPDAVVHRLVTELAQEGAGAVVA